MLFSMKVVPLHKQIVSLLLLALLFCGPEMQAVAATLPGTTDSVCCTACVCAEMASISDSVRVNHHAEAVTGHDGTHSSQSHPLSRNGGCDACPAHASLSCTTVLLTQVYAQLPATACCITQLRPCYGKLRAFLSTDNIFRPPRTTTFA
ncbi:MAG: hypothetical protein LBS77_04685 [Desulfovibrio sp.]|nr:hypothetical protein [Desulfovibrio sp.]